MPLAVPVSTSSLLEGDSLTSEEFLRRWDEIEDLKYAELIDGIVYMASPVSKGHEDCQLFLAGWVDFYATFTPGCSPGGEGTWLMGERQVPQPDISLSILPEFGGQSRVEGVYSAGAPELIVEVAVSSRSRDFGVKKRLYERAGVREYAIVLPAWKEIFWFERTETGFVALERGGDGVWRSGVFPGLWLDEQALWERDRPRRNAVLQEGLATGEHAAFAAELAARTAQTTTPASS